MRASPRTHNCPTMQVFPERAMRYTLRIDAGSGGVMDFEEFKRCGLLAEIAAAFTDEKRSRSALERIGYPVDRMPDFGPTFWPRVCEDLARGAFYPTLDMLLAIAAREFPDRPAFALVPRGPSTGGSPIAAAQQSPASQSSSEPGLTM